MINKLSDFKKLKTREKALLIVLFTAVGGGVFFNIVIKPLSGRIKSYQIQFGKSMSRLYELRSKSPETNRVFEVISALNSECQRLKDNISDIESKLPSRNDTSQLLNELIQQAKDINLVSVRQKAERQERYTKIFIELKFNTNYANTINYFKKIESISPFLTIQELDITHLKGKKGQGGNMPTRLVISSLLGTATGPKKIKTDIDQEYIEVSRDIFAPTKRRVIAPARKLKVNLEGITYNFEAPTAIIDGEVVRKGSEIDDLSVKEIFPEMVVLTDGIDEFKLQMER